MSNERPQVNIRAEREAIEAWESAARASGLSLSAWMRLTLIKAARRELAPARKAAA